MVGFLQAPLNISLKPTGVSSTGTGSFVRVVSMKLQNEGFFYRPSTRGIAGG